MMIALFGFMDYLIINKWLIDWDGIGAEAPGIIELLIIMFMKGGATPKGSKPGTLKGDIISNQQQVM